MRENWLYEIPDSKGIPTRLVTKMNGSALETKKGMNTIGRKSMPDDS